MAELQKNAVCGDFSTSIEIDTGETWVDGKKIYRKTLVFSTTIQANVLFEVKHGIQDVDAIWVDLGNSFLHTSTYGNCVPFSTPAFAGNSEYIAIQASRTKIVISSNSGWNENWTKVITARYTKK